MNRFLIIACLLSLILLLPSCSWLGRLFGKHSTSRGVVLVQVTPWFGEKVPLYAEAYTRKKGKRGESLATHRVAPDGAVSFVLPMHETYGVLAYADLNRNSRREKNEPTASAENLAPLSPYGTGPAYAPVPIQLPGKGVPRSTTPRAPDRRVLTAEDEKRINQLREHLPDSFRLPNVLPPLPQP